jgi:hypothetical protein
MLDFADVEGKISINFNFTFFLVLPLIYGMMQVFINIEN